MSSDYGVAAALEQAEAQRRLGLSKVSATNTFFTRRGFNPLKGVR